MNAKKGFLIYPSQNQVKNDIRALIGYGGQIGNYGFPVPQASGTEKTVERRMDVWKDMREITITIPLEQKPQKIELDGQLGADRDMGDNMVVL